MTIKTLVSKINLVEKRKQRNYDKMIAESQAKLAAVPQIPGYVNVYA